MGFRGLSDLGLASPLHPKNGDQASHNPVSITQNPGQGIAGQRRFRVESSGLRVQGG